MQKFSSTLRVVAPFLAISFLEAIGNGMIRPCLPIVQADYFAQQENHAVPIHCTGEEKETPACKSGNEAASLASSVALCIGHTAAFLICPWAGRAADVWGRRPFILIALACSTLPILGLVAYQAAPAVVPIELYLFGSAMHLALPSMSIITAALADLAPEAHRTPAFGMQMAAYSVGMLLGSQVARISMVETSWATSSLTANWILLAAIATQAGALSCAACVPEPLQEESRVGVEGLQGAWNPLKGLVVLRRSRLFARLTVCISIYFFSYQGLYQYSTFYEDRLLGFDEDDFATNELIHSLLNILLLAGLIKLLCNAFQ